MDRLLSIVYWYAKYNNTKQQHSSFISFYKFRGVTASLEITKSNYEKKKIENNCTGLLIQDSES